MKHYKFIIPEVITIYTHFQELKSRFYGTCDLCNKERVIYGQSFEEDVKSIENFKPYCRKCFKEYIKHNKQRYWCIMEKDKNESIQK